MNRQQRGAAAAPGAPTAATPRPPAAASPGASSGLPSGTTGTSPGAAAGAPSGPVAAVPPRPTTGALQPQDIYQAAYIDFSKGSYSLAIAGFREFLRRYPDHELAGSAQYWIGEAYLSLARGFTDAEPERQGLRVARAGGAGVQEGAGELPAGRQGRRPRSTRRRSRCSTSSSPCSPRPACSTSSTTSRAPKKPPWPANASPTSKPPANPPGHYRLSSNRRSGTHRRPGTRVASATDAELHTRRIIRLTGQRSALPRADLISEP